MHISKDFFKFIKYIKACYITILLLEMIISYQNISLTNRINNKLTNLEQVLKEFQKFFNKIDIIDEIRLKIYKYVLLKFKRIYSRYFVRSINAKNRNKFNEVKNLAKRIKVIIATAIIKVKSFYGIA